MQRRMHTSTLYSGSQLQLSLSISRCLALRSRREKARDETSQMWERQSLRIQPLLHTNLQHTRARTHICRDVQMHTVKAIQTFTGPRSQTEKRWITSQSCSPGLIMTSACHDMTILEIGHKCWMRWGRGGFWTPVFLFVCFAMYLCVCVSRHAADLHLHI